MKRIKSKIGMLGSLSVSLFIFSIPKPAFSQNSSFPSGIYNAGSRYVFIAHNEDRTCYSAVSVPPGRYAIAVGETTGSLSRHQDGFIVDGWRDYYGKEVVLTLEDSTIAVTHQGNHAGSYTLYERRPSNDYREDNNNVMARCLNSEDVFFEASPGYTITIPRIQTAQSQTTDQPQQEYILRESGSLSSTDSQLSDNSYYDRYSFTGKAGQQVTISMQSSAFDTYLLLVDENGNTINENDDSNRETANSEINAALPADGEYDVIANSYDALGQGAYVLTVTSADNSRQSSQTGSTSQSQSTPQASTSGCDVAIAQLRSSLTDGRQLSIPYQDTKEAYGEYPEGRSVIYSLGIQGAAGSSVLNSPQLLLSLGEAFLNNCSTAGAVSIGYYASSIGETIGIVNGRVALFECAENIGIRPRGARTREIPWGYHYCSL